MVIHGWQSRILSILIPCVSVHLRLPCEISLFHRGPSAADKFNRRYTPINTDGGNFCQRLIVFICGSFSEIQNSKPFQSHRLMSRSIVLDAISMHCSSDKVGSFLLSASINRCAFLRSPSTWLNITPYNLSLRDFRVEGATGTACRFPVEPARPHKRRMTSSKPKIIKKGSMRSDTLKGRAQW